MAQQQTTPASIKETLTSILIAFVLAFVFRGFVVEAFVIPTGSMAPTLRGQFMEARSEQTGLTWAVGPRDYTPAGEAKQIQGSQGKAITVHDLVTLAEADRFANEKLLAGDRIFVLKYLFSLYDPQRFDVVVFKNPNDPTMNYIKRLIGLPGEQLALIDGDIFTRPMSDAEDVPLKDDKEGKPWSLDGWSIARKPELAQRAVWQQVFRSDLAPLVQSKDGRKWPSPWRGGDGWLIEGRYDYQYKGARPTVLEWDSKNRSIEDSYSYNEASESLGGTPYRFPVADVRVSLGVRPEKADLGVGVVISARGHEFRTSISGTTVRFEMRPAGDATAAWQSIGGANLSTPLPAGEVTNLEFWHADQELQLWREHTLVGRARYDWTPAQRLAASTGSTLAQLVSRDDTMEWLSNPANYRPVQVRAEFTGGDFTLYRVGLDRDIFYRPDRYRGGNNGKLHTLVHTPAGGTHPFSTMRLDKNEFFMCGDNSPASLDGRLWDVPSPYVAPLDPDMGVVHRDLIIGRAFFVYFPAMHRKPVPDFGKMRWIW
ncbi:MAG: signal peptidase I [Phycisphaerales bacterium]